MKIFLFAIPMFLILSLQAQQLKIEIEGSLNLDQTTFFVDEAGEDFSSSLSENESTVYLAITDEDFLNKKSNPNNKWQVFVYLNGDQSSNLEIEIKRTGNGYKPEANGTPNIHDGENYMTVSNTSTYFFRGKGDIVYIPVQVRIKGGSVSMGAVDYQANLFFRVEDDWK